MLSLGREPQFRGRLFFEPVGVRFEDLVVALEPAGDIGGVPLREAAAGRTPGEGGEGVVLAEVGDESPRRRERCLPVVGGEASVKKAFTE